jgi:hypothetical protein
MTDYRRHRVPGGCYFFTVNLLEGAAILYSPTASVSCVKQFGVFGPADPSRSMPGSFFPIIFWQHAIGDDEDYGAHVDYIHLNPVKHGLVAAPGEWRYSTFRACVRSIGSAAACRSCQPANPADENIRRNTPEGYSDLRELWSSDTSSAEIAAINCKFQK